jgi:hypothetical protein
MTLHNNWDNQLKYLPQFEESPFEGTTPAHIFEIALITKRPVPDTEPSYRPQFVAGVIGRGTLDGQPAIFYSTHFMKWDDGRVFDSGMDGRQVRLGDLEDCSDAYHVLVPHDEMERPINSEVKSL